MNMEQLIEFLILHTNDYIKQLKKIEPAHRRVASRSYVSGLVPENALCAIERFCTSG
jgi:hypothetical protein